MGRAALDAIEQLRSLNVITLRRKYQELFGEESKSSNKQFLFRRIVWRLQADAEGGLSERARRRAAAPPRSSLILSAPGHRRNCCPVRFPRMRYVWLLAPSLSETGDCRRRAHCL